MLKHNYTIIEAPIGLIVPIWITEPRFYLLRLCIVDSITSVTHMFKELDWMGVDNDNLRQQFIQDFNKGKKVEVLDNLLNTYPSMLKSSHRHITKLKESIDLYFSSNVNVEFSSDLLFLNDFSDFTHSVLLALKNSSFGQVLSYGELAGLSGHPKAYRAVGSVMNKNPFPLIVPCHRVIRSDGNIGEFALGVDMKKILLQHESVL
jgi:methylated-DNA-[protein]-cysteine S-methyltransferase